jgi:hypothetical protein
MAAVPREKTSTILNRPSTQAAFAVVREEPLRLRPALAARLPREDAELRLLLARLAALRDFACAERDFDGRIPLLLRRVVRVPLSPLRPLLAEARLPRVLLLRVDAEREDLRPEPSPVRAVVFLREERPSLRFWFRELVEAVLRDLLREFELRALLLRALLREPRDALRCPRSLCAWFAVSRLTILLKLLRCPLAVVSWNRRAKPCSSNF